jgi:hypothetical protein
MRTRFVCQNPRRWRGFCFVLVLGAVNVAVAQPYRPASDAELLAELPARSAPGPQLRARDAALAARAAQVFIERGRRSGDPRDYGYAQGLLQPWWADADAPDAVLLLRATLRQHRHAFDAALADLDRLLARTPDHAQGLLTRATLHRVRGALDASLQDCDRLQAVAPGFASDMCRLAVQAQRDPGAALTEFDRLNTVAVTQTDELAAWLQAERGAAAERVGDAVRAEAAYRAGLARAPWDVGLRTALADLLIDGGRASEALVLLAEAPAEDDALRLRELLAVRASDTSRALALTDALAAAYASTRARGDTPHLREEAMFELKVRNDPQQALALAQANWVDQRELADARLLLAAARAADDRDTVIALQAWCARERVRDGWLEQRW